MHAGCSVQADAAPATAPAPHASCRQAGAAANIKSHMEPLIADQSSGLSLCWEARSVDALVQCWQEGGKEYMNGVHAVTAQAGGAAPVTSCWQQAGIEAS